MKKKIVLIIILIIIILGSIFLLKYNKAKENIDNQTKQAGSVVKVTKEKTLEEKKEEIKDFFTEEGLKNIKNVKDIVIDGENQLVVEKKIEEKDLKDDGGGYVRSVEIIMVGRDGKKINFGKFGQKQTFFEGSLVFPYNTSKKKYIVILSKEKAPLEYVGLFNYELGVYDIEDKKYIYVYGGDDGCDDLCIERGPEWKVTFPYKTKPQIIKYLKSIEKDGELKSQIQ